MTKPLLKTISVDEVSAERKEPVDAETRDIAEFIVRAIKTRGEEAVMEFSERFSDLSKDGALYIDKKEIEAARTKVPKEDLDLLERTAERISNFASQQLKSISDIEVPIPGGFVGHEIVPVERAGCYAPAGRFPLPSSLLMTAVTANAAGVKNVWVASPRPTPIILAAASCAQVDGLLCAGGAHGIAAMAYGTGPLKPCDVIVGPGNRFVTAAKQIVFGKVGIDMLAGPSELTILADADANPAIVASDILAQAEHDPDARPILVSLDADLVGEVNAELEVQLELLPTKQTAQEALTNGYAVVADDLQIACDICNTIAPEHLEICTSDPETVGSKCNNYGAIFLGAGSAEVLGDYGAGPNHTLPTGGTSRYTGGLSVFDFLRIRTWIKIDDTSCAKPLFEDATRFAQLEGLAGHAESARKRLVPERKEL